MPAVDVVLDTDVLIEVLRGAEQARIWLATIEQQVVGIPVLVWMELLLGARDKQEQGTLNEALAE